MRILIVDDNEANRFLAQSILEKENHIVVTAASGPKALIECEGVKFDLILLDILMPGMNGVTTLRKLRQTEGRNAKIPAFALTAYSSASDNCMYKQVGFEFVLSKPLRQKDLASAWKAYQNEQSFFEIPYGKNNIEQALINQTHWEEIMNNAPVKELVSVTSKFWKSADKCIMTIHENKIQASQADTESLSKLRKGAHTLKGSAATLALGRLESISGNLQNAAPEQILNLVADIEKCAQDSRQAHVLEFKALMTKHDS